MDRALADAMRGNTDLEKRRVETHHDERSRCIWSSVALRCVVLHSTELAIGHYLRGEATLPPTKFMCQLSEPAGEADKPAVDSGETKVSEVISLVHLNVISFGIPKRNTDCMYQELTHSCLIGAKDAWRRCRIATDALLDQ